MKGFFGKVDRIALKMYLIQLLPQLSNFNKCFGVVKAPKHFYPYNKNIKWIIN